MRRPPAPRAFLLAVVLGLGMLGTPGGGPGPVAGVGPLPECRLDDILTEPRGYDDWAITQVDWILTLGRDYRPPDLVNVRDAGVRGSGLIRKVAFDDLEAMAAAAEKNGTPLVSWSAFRGYNQQLKLFNGYAGWNGERYTNFDGAVTFSARPGHSEHQTGLTIDFVGVGDTGLTSNWEVTPTGGWMARNAWKYGWLMSYPQGKKGVTCYRYEPWHYRYVGRDLAAKIHDSGLTIREYLWAHYTQVDPACVALPPPPLQTPGTPRSCALAAPTPTPEPQSTAASTTEPTGAPSSLPPAETPAASVPGSPTSGPAATPSTAPTGVLGQALPIGVGVVLAVAALLAFWLWRSSGRARRRW
ncbi:MAG TPA: D-alanyl-D-alanine carboxypeptidase family protein [Candidatus Binatia bacterium]|nr:D-alanyl-D-alanine carboxypeptidase family protein [Candidatus Binatia bacterium]